MQLWKFLEASDPATPGLNRPPIWSQALERGGEANFPCLRTASTKRTVPKIDSGASTGLEQRRRARPGTGAPEPLTTDKA